MSDLGLQSQPPPQDDSQIAKGQKIAKDPTNLEAQKSSTKEMETLTADTKLESMNALKEKAPELYDKMIKGIAQNMISDMREHQERLKKKMREATEGR